MQVTQNIKAPEMLIDYYKAIEDSSARMLEAAKHHDWDEVVRCEGACAVLIEQLRYRSQDQELPPEQRKEKTRIMQRILRNDAQIRILAEPWLAQFDHPFEGKPQVLH
ncbi:flagellar protein FliT [Alicycliphilus denitrificans]|uniref:flagellar protein FliT n=1 Tax=Alicycliphilus denitrificans TaxID=179636 RepID=UPI00384D75CA